MKNLNIAKQNNIFLILGNHHSLSGCWEQVQITINTFKKAGISLDISPLPVKGAVNILIEDFNSFNVEYISKIAEDPDTKFVLYVTEYLRKRFFTYHLNVFSFKDIFFRWISLFLIKIRSQRLDLYLAPRSLVLLHKFNTYYTDRIFRRIYSLFGKDYFNDIMIARREVSLSKISNLFSLCISTTEAVLSGYSEFCSCELAYLPVFIDKEKSQLNRVRSKKLNGIFFSGRQTSYRRYIFNSIANGFSDFTSEISSSFPLLMIKKQNESLQKDFKTKTVSLKYLYNITEFDTYFSSAIDDNSFTIENSKIPIYEYLNQNETLIYEIYIPQDAKWEFSSPNRTLLSIESGFIPIDFGKNFTDHDINSLTLNIKTFNEAITILKSNAKTNYIELDKRIIEYNIIQANKLKSFSFLFEKKFSSYIN